MAELFIRINLATIVLILVVLMLIVMFMSKPPSEGFTHAVPTPKDGVYVSTKGYAGPNTSKAVISLTRSSSLPGLIWFTTSSEPVGNLHRLQYHDGNWYDEYGRAGFTTADSIAWADGVVWSRKQ